MGAGRNTTLSLMVEDIAKYEVGFRERGGRIMSGPVDYSWGRGFEAEVPGADSILIYEPKHALAVLTTLIEEIQG